MAKKRAGKGKVEGGQGPSLTGDDSTLLKALAHPVRARALTVLNQRTASPSELAKEQGEVVGYVAYHVRVLHELELIELVETRQVRGATEHFYRGAVKPYLSDEFWGRLPADARNGISVAGLDVINKAIKEAFEAGTFDARTDRHLSSLTVNLDEAAWREAQALLNTCLEGLMRIGAESESRDSAPTIRATFGMMGFESPPK